MTDLSHLSAFWSRRQMLLSSLRTGAGLAAAYALVPASVREAHAMQAQGEVIDERPFARLEAVADGIWAVVSTPFKARAFDTVCNGGIIAGRERVVAIDGYLRPSGAAWLVERCIALTGRAPTDVIVTHYHADHTGGLTGFQRGAEGPDIYATQTTYDTIIERNARPRANPNDPRVSGTGSRVLVPNRVISGNDDIEWDLGGRKITLSFTAGHTDSDIKVTIDDPRVVFTGDLIWEGIFPNFVDARPSELMANVRALKAMSNDVTFVPGHGAVTRPDDLNNYLGVLERIEVAARDAHKNGVGAADAAKDFSLPASVGEWQFFSNRYYEVAIAAWLKELG